MYCRMVVWTLQTNSPILVYLLLTSYLLCCIVANTNCIVDSTIACPFPPAHHLVTPSSKS